jgi:hypothetical protein
VQKNTSPLPVLRDEADLFDCRYYARPTGGCQTQIDRALPGREGNEKSSLRIDNQARVDRIKP